MKVSVFTPSHNPRFLDDCYRSMAAQTYDDWEIAADGSKHWYRWVDRAFLDENGTVVEFQSVGHDINEERRATALTEHQAEILEQVARGVPLRETLQTIAATERVVGMRRRRWTWSSVPPMAITSALSPSHSA